ncbi:MAG: 30S ribosomal protein S7 [Candidatus Tectomicrobia bacterium]|jgi:small subunit ribosomal protein S7|uniref:Small ribosomal subunit protein uS7 n=1 Tax=Tectimicrobiota bacterium TaxID=2528274 RepID=A0A932I1Z8_UNCTE|nr:30S ribosomal protein S7 [Candidatus Rokubacteria bacterium]MBI2131724.1 30S ribosomal protein S7 [Candidatus Tectomicrobia bacterium]MBI2179063.1 30S ribosomal protein S7 [Candidatus Tectomicrobia bacterium]MBI3128297.1 30S ribosomal protein S7 [Candidatus Tectomicrobia bacterium]
MARRKRITKRTVLPDPKYKDRLVTKFINALMYQGKKSLAERVFYGAMDMVEDKMKEDPLKVFKRALDNVKPALEVRSRRVGGATYQVPVEVRPDRRTTLSIRWLIENARSRDRRIANGLAAEIVDAANNTGGAVRVRENTHRMAEANKAFAHYRW